ncbi:MAG: class I SAM-dependent methyltransferase [bacterium]
MDLKLLKYFYGLDSLERHRAVARIVRDALAPPATLLDVGGEVSLRCNHLGRFLKGYHTTTLNVARRSDISYGGKVLPVGDAAFDVVVSLDTAEHVPQNERADWVKDFFRVARKFVILCGPLDTEFQRAADRELNDLFRRLFDQDHHYLSEHIACGLPNLGEIRTWTNGRPYQLWFDGDARIYRKHAESLFRWQKAAGPLKSPVKLLHQLYTLQNIHPLRLHPEPHAFTRRWYLRVDLSGT